MKAVLVIALIAAAIGTGKLGVVALYYELPCILPIAAGIGTIVLAIAAALVADGEEA